MKKEEEEVRILNDAKYKTSELIPINTYLEFFISLSCVQSKCNEVSVLLSSANQKNIQLKALCVYILYNFKDIKAISSNCVGFSTFIKSKTYRTFSA